MSEDPKPATRADPVLLLEVGLVLLLLGLFIALYWVPSGDASFVADWWVFPLLGGLFFGILLLEGWRRWRGNRAALRDVLREAHRDHDHPGA
jgi:type VI protein secretion system component VasK